MIYTATQGVDHQLKLRIEHSVLMFGIPVMVLAASLFFAFNYHAPTSDNPGSDGTSSGKGANSTSLTVHNQPSGSNSTASGGTAKSSGSSSSAPAGNSSSGSTADSSTAASTSSGATSSGQSSSGSGSSGSSGSSSAGSTGGKGGDSDSDTTTIAPVILPVTLCTKYILNVCIN